ncbi:MAG: endonuclease MutS2, partial [Bacteroidales bacterium]|nr:endonuclease MutS2 [Bacteroidales bacterium]
LGRLRASYVTLSEIKSYFDKLDAETYPQLCLFAQQLEIVPEVLPKIDTLLTRTGEIRDNASENLFRIRQLIRRKSGETQRYIVKYMDLAKKEGWVEDEADVTVRNERLVIPVTASHKKSMRGFIHDVSATGQTVFMEPEEIFNLNNEIVELRNEERVEIIEILKNFSAFLRPFLGVLTAAYRFLVRVDVLRGKALLAVKLDAGMPILHNKPCFVWRQARHPLLYLKDPKGVVPLDLSLADEEKIVMISGPNAGGKSVCLKTVGLLQYMLQCGLLVSMREDSEAGVVRDIFVDIGDEQSIENDLSTYSSHLKNMKFWVEHADKNTLFLSDELGSGTEPQVGGAIAEALVEFLLRKGARGIITTHYTNLKLMAKNHPGIVNGAMLFDQENLRPLYV